MDEKQNFGRTNLTQCREVLLMWARTHLATRPGGIVEPSDIVQEVLLAAHKQRDQFRGTTDAEYAAWLRRILTGRLTDAVRAARCDKRNAERVESLDAALADSCARLEIALGLYQSSPSEQAMCTEDLMRLADALHTLPEAQRQVILMRYAHGWSLDRVAGQIDRSPTAVGGLLRRGLKRMREILDLAKTTS
jgi:RNA polymerase sigma-70 factor (ECF subfamily)